MIQVVDRHSVVDVGSRWWWAKATTVNEMPMPPLYLQATATSTPVDSMRLFQVDTASATVIEHALKSGV